MTHRQIWSAATKFGWTRLYADRSDEPAELYIYGHGSGTSLYVEATVMVTKGKSFSVFFDGRTATYRDSTQLRTDLSMIIDNFRRLLGKPNKSPLSFTIDELLSWEEGKYVTIAQWTTRGYGMSGVYIEVESIGRVHISIQIM